MTLFHLANSACTLRSQGPHAIRRDVLNRRHAAKVVVDLLDLLFCFLLLFVCARDVQAGVPSALADGQFGACGSLHGLDALSVPQLGLFEGQLDKGRHVGSFCHALLECGLPLVNICLVTDEEDALRLLHDRQAGAVPQLRKLRGPALTVPATFALALALALHSAVVEAGNNIRICFHKGHLQALEEAVDHVPRFVLVRLLAGDLDGGRSVLFLVPDDVDLDLRPSVGLDPLHVLSVGTDECTSSVLVNGHTWCCARCRCCGIRTCSGPFLGHGLLDLRHTRLDLLRSSVHRHLVLLAVQEDALELALDLPGIGLLLAHDKRRLLWRHGDDLAVGEVEGLERLHARRHLWLHAANDEHLGRRCWRALATALHALGTVDDHSVLLLELRLVEERLHRDLWWQVHVQAHNAVFLQILHLHTLVLGDTRHNLALEVAGACQLRKLLVLLQAILTDLLQGEHLGLEVPEGLPAQGL
mmetsp:Transcript_9783/g.22316  ORF Transcript_9783/g.22316 Transcript_9783/m.22316 type:complete len:472 (+) Transcript_9783:948-2363(+)